MFWKPLLALLQSRKFMVLLLDTVIVIVLYYLKGDDVQFLIGVLQPVALMLIYAIAKEDSAALAAGMYPKSK